MTRRQAAAAYLRIARQLGKLDVGASEHISRCDNNQVFEIRWFLRDVGRRIKAKYPDTDYRRLLK